MKSYKLPSDVLELLNGKNLAEKQHEAMMLLTVSEDGFPHTAMISVGEIVVVDSNEVRIGMWKESSTTDNMIRTNKATLVLFYNGKAVYTRLRLERLPELPETHYPRERFIGTVVWIREDLAPYADITSGVKIQLKNAEDVIKRWEQTVKEILR